MLLAILEQTTNAQLILFATIEELAELMDQDIKEVEEYLKTNDVVELDLTEKN